MPMKFRKKQQRCSSEDDNAEINDEFKSKLNLLLRSPQGQEIKRRSWRISDKFMGGQKIEDYRADKTRRHRNKSNKSSDDIFDQFADYKTSKKSKSKKSKKSRRKRSDSSL